jgi:hypothetical protein
MDCWDISGQLAVFENCKVDSVTTYSGRTHLKFIDCTVSAAKLSLGEDGGGKCYALVYTSPNCEKAGTLNIYRNGSGATPVLDDTKYPYSMVEEYVSQNSALGHDNQSLAIYENGFSEKGYKRIGCTRCDDYEAGELAPLIVCYGYSKPEYDAGGISVRYSVSTSAVDEYEAITGNSLSYGLFAVTEKSLGDNEVISSDRTAVNGAAIVEFSSCIYSIFELKIVGFNEEQKDIRLALGAYIGVNNGESTEYSYIQAGEREDGKKYSFVSYNELLIGKYE